MIQSNELRIGNLVYDSNNELCEVESIVEGAINYELEYSELWTNKECFFENINPIPISEETLKLDDEFWSFEGFGTRLIYQHKQFKAIKIEYSNENDAFIYFNDNVINLRKYVHEVQNLFYALTSKELELK